MRKTCIFLLLTATALSWRAATATAADAATNRDAVASQAAAENDPLIVHEWGTFTTFSGSDGVYLDFRPLADEASDLPDFVLNRASRSQQSLLSKSRLRGKVRMETPVTYFYTDRIRQVNVRVAFPKGLLTEFYPPVQKMLPPFDESVAFRDGEPIGDSSLDWGSVTLIPTDQLVPGITDPKLRQHVSQHLAETAVPHGPHDRHYVQARATDSALVHVRGSDRPSFGNIQPPHRNFMEKFLFYRGVGRFELPLRAVFDEQGAVTLRNDGDLAIDSAIFIQVQQGKIRAGVNDVIKPGRSGRFKTMRDVTLDELSDITDDVLTSQGLYEKEAASMVETWKQSWFTEEGTRILYIVPEQITDELLPLTIKPVPSETLRVLVGRMEIMSPAAERKMTLAVRDSSRARSAHLEAQKGNQKKIAFAVPNQIHRFGRMTEPALVRVAKIARDADVRSESERLIAQLRGN